MLELLLVLYLICSALTAMHLFYSYVVSPEIDADAKEFILCVIFSPIYIYGIVRFER